MTTEDINMTLYKPLEVLNSHTMTQCTGTMYRYHEYTSTCRDRCMDKQPCFLNWEYFEQPQMARLQREYLQ